MVNVDRVRKITRLFQTAFDHSQRGRTADAERSYRKILSLDPSSADALHYLGLIALQSGKMQEAADLIGRSIVTNGNNPHSHYHIGLALAALGRFDATAEHNRRAIALKPDYAEAHLNLGNALNKLAQTDEALASYRRAITSNPDLAVAHFNLANILAQNQQFQAAFDSYQRALTLNPGYVEAHNNFGTALVSAGRWPEAAAQFRLAVATRPQFVEALLGVALTSHVLGKPAEAIGYVCRALEVRPTDDAKVLFAQCIRDVDILPDIASLPKFLAAAMAEAWNRPNDLAPALAKYIRAHSQSAAVRTIQPAHSGTGGEQFDFAALAGDTLLRCLLTNALVCDAQLEAVLTTARHELLNLVEDADGAAAAVLDFACLLARQCFISEYVFAVGDNELRQARQQRDRLSASLQSGKDISAFQVAVVAGYFPLHGLAGADTLLARPWPEPLASVIAQQVREPYDERLLRDGIAPLTPIEDEVSRQVGRQYEQNPYPRWVQTAFRCQPDSIDAMLRKRFPQVAFRALGKTENVDVLVAGCGTGQHPIETACEIAGASLLAIDLSLSSLCYAKRKASTLGIGNIEFAQADILTLPALGRTFDVIESVGVLHHLRDPMAGWRALTAVLRPGGFMRIGLYSQLARSEINGARAFAAQGGYRSDPNGIGRCRADLRAAGGELAEFMNRLTDFYTTSGCRDLLFHVQEHQLTLPQIAVFLAETGLKFLGFHLDPRVLGQYATRFAQDTAMTDLTNWHSFEAENPRTFIGMYQFWVQKPTV